MSFATEQNFKPIPEYLNFDTNRHFYAIESGGGDGWLAHQPLMDALKRDLQNVIDNDTLSPDELNDLKMGEWPEWISALYVFEKGYEANKIAEFDLAAWEWSETSSTSRADRRK